MSSILSILLATLAAVPAAAGNVAAGKTVFQARCVICHGQTGSGNPVQAKLLNTDIAKMDLAGPDVRSATPADLVKIVSQGRNKMPAFKDKLTPAQIGDVVAYVKSLPKAK